MTKAKSFKNQAAQGDVLIRKIEALPADAKPIETEAERHVVAHSETGHHHAITAPATIVQLFGSSDPLLGYMRVKTKSVELRHEREWDTHGPIKIGPGIYEIRRQREFTPEGWRRVED